MHTPSFFHPYFLYSLSLVFPVHAGLSCLLILSIRMYSMNTPIIDEHKDREEKKVFLYDNHNICLESKSSDLTRLKICHHILSDLSYKQTVTFTIPFQAPLFQQLMRDISCTTLPQELFTYHNENELLTLQDNLRGAQIALEIFKKKSYPPHTYFKTHHQELTNQVDRAQKLITQWNKPPLTTRHIQTMQTLLSKNKTFMSALQYASVANYFDAGPLTYQAIIHAFTHPLNESDLKECIQEKKNISRQLALYGFSVNHGPVFLTPHHTSSLTGHTASVYKLALTDNEEYLLSGSDDGYVKVWDTTTDECVATYSLESPINTIACKPYSSLFAVALRNGLIEIWDRKAKTYVKILKNDMVHAYEATWNHNGTQLAYGGQYPDARFEIQIYDTTADTFTHKGDFNLYDCLPRSLSYHPHKNLLAVADSTGRIALLNTDTMQAVKLMHPKICYGLSWSKKGDLLAYATGCGVCLLETSSWKFKNILQAEPYDQCYDPLWTFNDTYLIARSQNKKIYIWETQTGTRRAITPHDTKPWSFVYAPYKGILFTCHKDNNIQKQTLSKKLTFLGYNQLMFLAYYTSCKDSISNSLKQTYRNIIELFNPFFKDSQGEPDIVDIFNY